MKTLHKILAGSALLFTSLGVQAGVAYTKVSGTGFDVYYSSLGNYAVSVHGTKLALRLSGVEADVLGYSDARSQSGVLFVVAHGGKTVKSDFSQRFSGGLFFDGSPSVNNDVLSYQANSLIVKSDVATYTYDQQTRYAFKDDLYHVGSPGYTVNDGFDSLALPSLPDMSVVAVRSGENVGTSYNQFALLFNARVHAQAFESAAVRGSVEEIVYSFQTVDASADVPEPASLALFALGGVALAYRRRTRQ